MDKDLAFIQILDASKLRANSAKRKQWKTIERSIKSILPLRNSRITAYTLVTTDELDGLAPVLREIT